MTPGDSLTVEVPVRNVGGRPGTAVIQVYVSDPESSVARPVKELKGFAKVRLDAGRDRVVTIELAPRAFVFWAAGSGWTVEAGRFEIGIGTSAEAITERLSVEMTATATLA